MSKVKCRVCVSEENGFCTIKKNKVATNKARKCDAYVRDEDKNIIKNVIPSKKFGFKEQKELKRRYKEELRKIKEYHRAVAAGEEAGPNPIDRLKSNPHPLTGNLSQFK